jgi:transposase-like protein
VALAIRLDGQKELALGRAKRRGIEPLVCVLDGDYDRTEESGVVDILFAAVDGLTGFPNAIAAVFPKTEVQLCIVHMVRNSVRFVPYKDRKAVSADLKNISGKWTMPIGDWRAICCHLRGRQGSPMIFRLHKIIYRLMLGN